jgi:hypothetical protein
VLDSLVRDKQTLKEERRMTGVPQRLDPAEVSFSAPVPATQLPEQSNTWMREQLQIAIERLDESLAEIERLRLDRDKIRREVLAQMGVVQQENERLRTEVVRLQSRGA